MNLIARAIEDLILDKLLAVKQPFKTVYPQM